MRAAPHSRALIGFAALTVLTLGIPAPDPAHAIPSATARPGHAVLDPSFGRGTGWATTSSSTGSLYGYAVAAQSDGKIVVAGQSVDGEGNAQIVVARYRPGGRLDSAFGTGGVFATVFPDRDGPFSATAVAVHPRTGKILVAGGYGAGSFLVMRLRRDGRVDRSFGANHDGVTTTAVGGIAESLAIDPRGRIYVGGSDAGTPGRPMVVARYRADGSLDRRFAGTGIKRLIFWDPGVAAGASVGTLAFTRNGDLVGVGAIDYIGGDGHGSAGAFRLSNRGKERRSFGADGHVEVAFPKVGGGFSFWFPCAALLGAHDRLTVVGDGNAVSAGAVMAARLDRRGRLDLAYGPGGDGRSMVEGASDGSTPNCGAAPAPGGRVSIGLENVLVQLTASGRPNQAFAPGGTITLGSPANAQILGLARYGARRFVVTGMAGSDTIGLFVGRVRQFR